MSAPDDWHADPGRAMYALAAELFPVCRSITGQGVRTTLARLAELVPLSVREVPSGTQVFDWRVPPEWTIRDAYIKDETGRRIVDFQQSNLHVVQYSTPIRAKMRLDTLRPHLHSLPEHPDWIPYRTSYYEPTWGFCLPHRQLVSLSDQMYEVCIDATLQDGALTFGELHLAGAHRDEVLLSAHVCHPSLANDNLSGVVVAAFVARHLMSWPSRRFSYRMLFAPGTIGAITWLALNENAIRHIRHGLVLGLLGDAGSLTYKRTRRGDSSIDRIVESVLARRGDAYSIRAFDPFGYDERQYCSPGFDLPVGRLTRTPGGEYPEYHTSADDMSLLQANSLHDSWEVCLEVIRAIEAERVYRSQCPKCEPQLGKRGLYPAIAGQDFSPQLHAAVLWMLSFSDGRSGLNDIAQRSGLPIEDLERAAELLVTRGLLAAER